MQPEVILGLALQFRVHVRVDRHRRPPRARRHATSRVRGYSPLIALASHVCVIAGRLPALVVAAVAGAGASPAPRPPVRLAAGPSAFPPGRTAGRRGDHGLPRAVVPPLAPGELPARSRPGRDARRGRRPADRGGAAHGDRRAFRDGLGDVPGRLRDPVRDVGGALRAVPYLWSPQLFLARSRPRRRSRRRPACALLAPPAARAALPDSPLELAPCCALPRHRRPLRARPRRAHLGAAGRRACESPAPPLQQRHAAARALPPGRDRPRAGQPRDARQSARRLHHDPAQ